jgi:hypothetical protein
MFWIILIVILIACPFIGYWIRKKKRKEPEVDANYENWRSNIGPEEK